MRHPISAEAFAEWVSRQPAEKEYHSADPFSCALYQYFKAHGLPVYLVGWGSWEDTAGHRHPFPRELMWAVSNHPHTFGALHQRLTGAQQ